MEGRPSRTWVPATRARAARAHRRVPRTEAANVLPIPVESILKRLGDTFLPPKADALRISLQGQGRRRRLLSGLPPCHRQPVVRGAQIVDPENISQHSPARYTIALVQREVEPLHTPGYDISVYLSRNPRWLVRKFTEQTVHLLPASDEFDCVVLAVDSLYHNPPAVEALSSKITCCGMLVLHQLDERALSFLRGEHALTHRKLGAECDRAYLPETLRPPHDEPLLNWPHRIALDSPAPGQFALAQTSRATWSLVAADSSPWKTVLEVHDVVGAEPVVLRTGLGRTPRMVVCYLFLEPRRARDAHLLENMIVFCSEGIPDVAVLDDRRAGSSATAHKLRMLGASVAHVRQPPGDGTSFDEWPVRGAATVVMEGHYATAANSPSSDRWLAAGGTIVRGNERGGLDFEYGSTDQQWLSRQFAKWLKSVDPASWHGGVSSTDESYPGSIWKTRAVLRVLQRFYRDPRVDPRRVGLQPPTAYEDIAVQLLRRRVGDHGDFDCTISTTAAACDIAGIVGGGQFSLEPTRRWLVSRFEDAQLEDRFDISRALRRRDLFEKAYAHLRETSSGQQTWHPLLVARLLAAAVACGARPPELTAETTVDHIAEIDTSLVLAAEYVDARLQFHKGEDLSWLDRDDTLRALRTMQRHGRLLNFPDSASSDDPAIELEILCTETLAMQGLLSLDRMTTHQIQERDRGYRPQHVDAVLRQNDRIWSLAMRREQQLRANRGDLRALGRVRHAMGVLAVLLAVAPFVAILLVWQSSAETVTFGIVLAVVAYSGLLFLLDGLRLRPTWTSRMLAPLQDGLSGIPRWLADRMRAPAEPGAGLSADPHAGVGESPAPSDRA
jgi:hypothetical protein